MAEIILHDHFDVIPGGVLLVPGSGGIFEVTLNGRNLYSKEQTGRFPNENEVEDILAGVVSSQ